MKIRPASASDARSIADIHANSWRHAYRDTLTAEYLAEVVSKERHELWINRFDSPKPNQLVAIAEQDGEIIGFACAFVGEHAEWGSYLDNLHVRQDHQSKGIGKSLLVEIWTWCNQKEPNSGLCLTVNQDNAKAQAFYKSLGAQNRKVDLWNAPDGSTVPTYWFVWDPKQLEGGQV